jgi:catechol 2,3-dioxygenase-like lactoylglutathione lyase family enzyme
MLKYICALFAVEDLAVSRRFYEECLGQKVTEDHGEGLVFEGGLSIHRRESLHALFGREGQSAPVGKTYAGELYFETDDLPTFEQRVRAFGVEFIHPIQEQPWAQRVMRFYDPDGHVIEIGETLEAVARRLYAQGLMPEEIHAKIGMPLDFIEKAIQLKSAEE